MKKNGFTLVELLAIIAVLTAIMLLVLPKFSSSVNDRKQKEYNKLIKTIENAGRVYHIYNQGKNKVSINELVKEDLLTSDIKSPIDDTLISGCVFFGKSNLLCHHRRTFSGTYGPLWKIQYACKAFS